MIKNLRVWEFFEFFVPISLIAYISCFSIIIFKDYIFSHIFGSPGSSYKGRSKCLGYPGREHRQGAEEFFSKKKLEVKTFFSKKKGVKTFFTTKFENPRFHFLKQAIFEDQKVGSSDSSVFIGV